MPPITIRDLPEYVHRELEVRAARAGRSTEAEVRVILTEACQPSSPVCSVEDLQRLVDKMYGGQKPVGVVDDLIRERRQAAKLE